MAELNQYPLPWTPAPNARWLLIAANGNQVATFQAWHNQNGVLPDAEKHCALVAEAVNGNAAADNGIDVNWNDLRIMQRLIVQWANNAMPNRTPSNALLKMTEETAELIRDPTDPEEYADILVMLVDLAAMHGVHDLGEAVRKKMKVNANRTWSQTSTGIMRHDPD